MDVVLDAVAAPYIFPLLLASSSSLHLSSLTPLSLPPTDKDKCCGGLSFLRRCPWGLRHHISLFHLFDDVILFPHCNRFVPNGSIYPWSTLAPFYSPLLIPRSFSPSLCLSQLAIECLVCFLSSPQYSTLSSVEVIFTQVISFDLTTNLNATWKKNQYYFHLNLNSKQYL